VAGGCVVWVTCAYEVDGAASASASAPAAKTVDFMDTNSSFRLRARFAARVVPFAHNVVVSALDDKIDELYSQPLDAFIDARTALAKTLSGADAQRVRKLAKPTVVPWAVNRVYWNDRAVYDAVLESGDELRKAQVAALEGRRADVRAATNAHRAAIAQAIKTAERLASSERSKPDPNALMRTFEALSLSTTAVEHGRLTRPLQPAGFEALGGLGIDPRAAARAEAAAETKPSKKDLAAMQKAEAARRKEEADRRKREVEIKKAEAAVERARRRMAEAEALLRETRNREP
jgi:hypothetical protein